MITLDGTYLEGGGQILRTALALSTITGKPFEIADIRKNRPEPGLKMQHLHCIKALQKLCDAKTADAFEGSESITFVPGKIKGGTINVDIGTAGSITLLLQSVLLPCLFAEKKTIMRITGGTDVRWSPSFDYFFNVLLPQLRKYADITVKLEKRGFYPAGGGKVIVKIKPHGIMEKKEINLIKQKKVLGIRIYSIASLDLREKEVSERQAKAARYYLNQLGCPMQIESSYAESPSTGSVITIVANLGDEEVNLSNPMIMGADSLGEKGKTSEQVGEEAAKSLLQDLNSMACVDRFMGDQILPLLALFGGRVKIPEFTNHLLTNIYTIEKFLDIKFDIDKERRIISAKHG